MIMETGASMNKDDTTHRIVVGVDGSEHSMAALEWAAVQAQRTGVDLEVVAAFGPGYRFLSRSEADKCMQEDVAEAMVRAEKLAPGVDITSTTFEGPPETGLITEGAGADLLVVGSRGLGGFKCLLLGSVSRACVHRARCPVVVVAQPGPASDALMTERDERSHRIVVGIDGSPSSIAALEWAANQAERTGASLEVLMTWEWLTGYGWSPMPPDFEPGTRHARRHSAILSSQYETRILVSPSRQLPSRVTLLHLLDESVGGSRPARRGQPGSRRVRRRTARISE
jgi:nucleotide-binding universal stress UspA family protein